MAHIAVTYSTCSNSETECGVAVLYVGDAALSHFVDLDKDGVFEFESSDYTFAYWNAAFVESPAPPVILRFTGSAYELALSLMRKPAPSSAEYKEVLRGVRESFKAAEFGNQERVPPSLWGQMLDLIYTGHPNVAWNLLADAWPHSTASRKTFLNDFCSQLTTSQYFKTLRPTLKEAPCIFDPKRGRHM